MTEQNRTDITEKNLLRENRIRKPQCYRLEHHHRRFPPAVELEIQIRHEKVDSLVESLAPDRIVKQELQEGTAAQLARSR